MKCYKFSDLNIDDNKLEKDFRDLLRETDVAKCYFDGWYYMFVSPFDNEDIKFFPTLGKCGCMPVGGNYFLGMWCDFLFWSEGHFFYHSKPHEFGDLCKILLVYANNGVKMIGYYIVFLHPSLRPPRRPNPNIVGRRQVLDFKGNHNVLIKCISGDLYDIYSDKRYVIIDRKTGDVLDDCKGEGYTTVQSAVRGFSYKNKSDDKKKITYQTDCEILSWLEQNSLLKQQYCDYKMNGKKVNADALRMIMFSLNINDCPYKAVDIIRMLDKMEPRYKEIFEQDQKIEENNDSKSPFLKVKQNGITEQKQIEQC